MNAKEKIFDAFCSLCESKNIKKISVKEVAELAGYHRSAFYRNFNDMADLLYQLNEATAQEIADNITICNYKKPSELRVRIFSLLYDKNNKRVKTLMKYDEQTGFSLILKNKCISQWKKVFGSHGDIHENILIEYAVSGSIAVQISYYQGRLITDIEELNSELDKITSIIFK